MSGGDHINDPSCQGCVERDSRIAALETQLAELDRLRRESVFLRDEAKTNRDLRVLTGESKGMKAVRHAIQQVAKTESTVLILGETGTGKELVARAIHQQSQRRNRLLVTVNCAALAPSLIASELFGHEAGAFTGAARRRLGRFELAHHGTIFLDEIGELPGEAQVMLLRALQERTIERVGSGEPIDVDAGDHGHSPRSHGNQRKWTISPTFFSGSTFFPFTFLPCGSAAKTSPISSSTSCIMLAGE